MSSIIITWRERAVRRIGTSWLVCRSPWPAIADPTCLQPGIRRHLRIWDPARLSPADKNVLSPAEWGSGKDPESPQMLDTRCLACRQQHGCARACVWRVDVGIRRARLGSSFTLGPFRNHATERQVWVEVIWGEHRVGAGIGSLLTKPTEQWGAVVRDASRGHLQ